jgi:hypothetical protein
MKNIIRNTFLALTTSLLAFGASAQSGFSFSKSNQTYTKLSGATSLTKGNPWTVDSSYIAPLGFNFKMNGTTVDKVYLSGGNFVSSSKGAVQSGFILAGTGLMDRGILLGTARSSDIRYLTSGTAGSRIFKLEIYNAGFEDEFLNNGELKDSISIQLWLYEGSNVAEFRYGSSAVNNFSDYFGPQMMCGYMKNMDTVNVTFEKFYVVNGTAASPTLDSTTVFPGTKGLSAVPANGTVFRFAPKGNSTTGITRLSAGVLANVFPTQCTGTLNVSHSNQKPLSYSIVDMAGQEIAHGYAPTGSSTIDVSAIAAGTYVIRLMNEEANTYEGQKFVKL